MKSNRITYIHKMLFGLLRGTTNLMADTSVQMWQSFCTHIRKLKVLLTCLRTVYICITYRHLLQDDSASICTHCGLPIATVHPTNTGRPQLSLPWRMLFHFNLHPTNAPCPFKAASYERTKKFKCPVHSYRGLELQPCSLSTHYIMVCGQTHAPATLPNYVHMCVMNSSF